MRIGLSLVLTYYLLVILISLLFIQYFFTTIDEAARSNTYYKSKNKQNFIHQSHQQKTKQSDVHHNQVTPKPEKNSNHQNHHHVIQQTKQNIVQHNQVTPKPEKNSNHQNHHHVIQQTKQNIVQHNQVTQKIVNSNHQNIIIPKTKPRKKSILIYSTLFDLQYWPTLSIKESKTFMKRCVYSQCTITYNKDAISTSDAVLFHGVDVQNNKKYSSDILRIVSKLKRDNQKWVFFIQESPDNYNGFSDYSGLFDWQMSYKYTSDIMVPYGYYATLSPSDPVPSKDIKYYEGKSMLGIWIVSHCGKSRDHYMKELRKYIPITVVGKCSKEIFGETTKCDSGSNDCLQLIKKHKFYFSFENSFCDYYVSEKYWNKGIDYGIVPVVMGARYDDTIVIPGSFIDASKYESIKELARYLIYLNENDDAYNEYFAWKQKFKRIGMEKMCELCKALHENIPSKHYKNIWNAEDDCRPFDWKKEFLLKLAEQSRNITLNN